MQEFIEKIQSPILLFTSGIILFTCDIIVFIVFINNKQLRTGIYYTVLMTIFGELIFALHSILMGIINFSGTNVKESSFCIAEGFFLVYFSVFWVCENTSIMLLYLTRKIEKSRLCKYLHFFSVLFSLMISLLLLFNDSLGSTAINTCFINEKTNHSLFFISACYFFLFILSILYNIWFFKLRDTKKDRSFINGYNYFMMITSFFYAFYFINLMIDYSVDSNVSFLYFISVFIIFINSIYTSIFRIKIEHVTLFFCDEEGNNKYKNIFLFIICKYKLPKFKDVKKKLNVKFIDTNESQKSGLIYNHIFDSKDFSY